MKNRSITTTAFLLIVFTAVYLLVISDGSTRAVEFLVIFAIGALFGVLLTQFIGLMGGKKQTTPPGSQK
jgi:hypothetical protein